MSSASVPAISMPEGDIPVAAASSSKDDESLSTIPPAKPQSYMQQALGLFRASCVFGILLGATATNVTVAMLIHAATRDRKKAQGMFVGSGARILPSFPLFPFSPQLSSFPGPL